MKNISIQDYQKLLDENSKLKRSISTLQKEVSKIPKTKGLEYIQDQLKKKKLDLDLAYNAARIKKQDTSILKVRIGDLHWFEELIRNL